MLADRSSKKTDNWWPMANSCSDYTNELVFGAYKGKPCKNNLVTKDLKGPCSACQIAPDSWQMSAWDASGLKVPIPTVTCQPEFRI